MTLKQLTQARWFPTVSKPLLSGLLASGIVFGLHAVGITSFTSNEVNAAAAPLVGFLVTAIAAQPKNAPDPAPQPDVVHTIIPLLLPNLEQLIKDNPDILLQLLADAQKVGQAQAVDVSVKLDGRKAAGTMRPPEDDSGVIR